MPSHRSRRSSQSASTRQHAVLMAGLLGFTATALAAGSWQGELSLGVRQFAEPNEPVQANTDVTLSGKLKYQREWNDGYDELTIEPIFRVNSEDSEQNRVDFQSLSWNHQTDLWSFRTGVRTVTWQVVESLHLVDVVNQIDAAADVDGEDKLGELMFNVVRLTDWGNIELLIMPGFRERILPGEEGRLRPPLSYEFPVGPLQTINVPGLGTIAVPVPGAPQSVTINFDPDFVTYESAAEELRTDAAIRATWIPGDWEITLSHFSGTSREPQIVFSEGVLHPNYPVIDQTGLELQYAAGNWLWKAEAISNSGFEEERYAASVAGFEYTFSGLGETGYDIGALAEYLWDEREDAPLRSDIFVGGRLSLNDIAGTQLLLGGIVDHETGEYLALAEFSRRLGSKMKIEFELRAIGQSADDERQDFGFLHKDDYANLTITRYF